MGVLCLIRKIFFIKKIIYIKFYTIYTLTNYYSYSK